MQIPTNLLPPITGVVNAEDLKRVWGIRPARPVAARTLPPLIVQRPQQLAAQPLQAPAEAQPPVAAKERAEEERRKYCRRLERAPSLLDTRAAKDRRGQKRRDADPTTTIVVEV